MVVDVPAIEEYFVSKALTMCLAVDSHDCLSANSYDCCDTPCGVVIMIINRYKYMFDISG